MYRAGILSGLLLLGASLARADVAVVVEHQWTIDNNYFSAFAYDPALEEFRSGGYASNQTIRWSHILDDSVEPWEMEGDVLLNWFQLGIFARDGFASNSGSFSLWGMNYNPLDGKYFLTGIGILRPPSGRERLDAERDLIILDDRLPDSLLTLPTYTTLSNTGGIYRLEDTSENADGSPRAAFVSSGVQPGDRITLFPVDIWAEVLSATYTVTEVVSETELRLLEDPCWGPNTTTTGVGYLLSIQPHLTLAAFRQNIPYYAEDYTRGPKAHYKGGLSPDGTTLYLGDIVSNNVIAVNTQVKEDLSIFVPASALRAYVQSQVDAGRHMAYINPVQIYTERVDSAWTTNPSTGVTLDPQSIDPVYSGTYALAVTYTQSPAELVFEWDDPNMPLMTSDYDHLEFAIHGGGAGAQQITLHAYDENGTPGNVMALDPPPVNSWQHVTVPASAFGVSTIRGIVFRNNADGAQATFHLDEVQLRYTDPPPPDVGAFDPNSAGPAPAQVATDADGAVWFSEGETDDILKTTDGQTFDIFMTSNEVAEAVRDYSGSGAWSTGLQVMGLTLDRMGTVYWSDNLTKAIWKAPKCGGAENIRCLASKAELQEALGLGTSTPRGLNCFSIRGNELLTFNFVDGNFIFKVDLDTYDYGDFDEDIDVDVDDLNALASVMQGPDITTAPAGLEELFGRADLDQDGDVDLHDALKLQRYATGALPPSK